MGEKTNNPRDEMLFLLENWDFTLPETKVRILDLYFKDVETKVKEANLNNDTSLLEEELEHANNLSDRLGNEFARYKIHGYIIQRERKKAFKGLLEIECFILDITEKSLYVPEDHKDWVSGITTKHVSRGDLLDLMEEYRFHECLLKWGVGGKTNEEKGPPSPMKKPGYYCKKNIPSSDGNQGSSYTC